MFPPPPPALDRRLKRTSRARSAKSLGAGFQGPLKGEIHSKIESILKERVQFPTEQCKNDENWMKNKEDMTFEISNIFGKHFLTSPYEYSNERVDDVIPSQFFIYIVYEILKFFHL